MRRSIVLAIAFSAVFAGSAGATIPSGKYQGTFGSPHQLPMSFSVKNGRLLNFTAHPLALCIAYPVDQFELQTFFIPSAKIRNGKVSAKYNVLDSANQVIARRNLTATFSGSKASGTFSGTSVGCTIAKYQWTAHH